MTLALYSTFVVIEMALHLIRGIRYGKEDGGALANAEKKEIKLILFMDFLQIPLSIVFTRFLNIFSALIPQFYGEGESAAEEMAVRVGVGRTIAVFNHFTYEPMMSLAGQKAAASMLKNT